MTFNHAKMHKYMHLRIYLSIERERVESLYFRVFVCVLSVLMEDMIIFALFSNDHCNGIESTKNGFFA